MESEYKYEPGDYRIKISADSAEESIRKNLLNFELKKIEPIGEGMGSNVFLVNNEDVFKFAKHEKASGAMEMETAVLDELQDVITLPIPDVKYQGIQTQNRLKFFGYGEIKGTGLVKEDLQNEVVRQRVAAQLAQFLNEMHSFDKERAEQAGVKEVDNREFYTQQLKEARNTLYPELEANYPNEAKEVEDYIEKFFDAYLRDKTNFEYTPTVVHNDLEGDRAIIYDPEKKELAGIIDFGSVKINDPDFDLWRLYAHYGRDFLDEILSSYPHGDTDKLMGKLDFYWKAQDVRRAVRAEMVGDKENVRHKIASIIKRSEENKNA